MTGRHTDTYTAQTDKHQLKQMDRDRGTDTNTHKTMGQIDKELQVETETKRERQMKTEKGMETDREKETDGDGHKKTYTETLI